MIPNANRIMKNYYTKAKYGDIQFRKFSPYHGFLLIKQLLCLISLDIVAKDEVALELQLQTFDVLRCH